MQPISNPILLLAQFKNYHPPTVKLLHRLSTQSPKGKSTALSLHNSSQAVRKYFKHYSKASRQYICHNSQDTQVTLVELARPSPSLPELLSGIGSTLVGVDQTMKTLLQDLTFSDGVQARMDGILFQRLEGSSNAKPIFALIRDYLGSL